MDFLAEVFKPANLPAWLQATAAIVALGISVYAVRANGADERKRARLELRGIVVAIYPELGMLEVTARSVRNRLDTIKEQFKGQVGQSIAATVQMNTVIAVPPMLDRYTDKLFLLGDIAGPSCVHLVRMILQYNSVADSMASRVAVLNADEWPEAIGHIEKHLGLLDKIIAKCKQEVQPLHDAIDG
jgi:hypothetical protein